MSESFGTLVDRLITLDMKVWHVQDWVYKAAAMPPAEFARMGHAEIQGQLKKLADLNIERNRAMTEIDQFLDGAIKRGGAPVESRIKIT